MVSRVVVGRAIGVLAILIVLISFKVVGLISRGRTYRDLAQYHAGKEAVERRNVETFEAQEPLPITGVGELEAGSPIRLRWAEASRRRIAFHSKLKQKYEAAASRPWVTVEADPPDPGSSLLMPKPLHTLTDNVKFIVMPQPSTIDRSVQPAVDRTP
jgi:hypothetical protein